MRKQFVFGHLLLLMKAGDMRLEAKCFNCALLHLRFHPQ